MPSARLISSSWAGDVGIPAALDVLKDRFAHVATCAGGTGARAVEAKALSVAGDTPSQPCCVCHEHRSWPDFLSLFDLPPTVQTTGHPGPIR